MESSPSYNVMGEITRNLNYQPANLSKEDLANPMFVINEFFEENKLHQVRQTIWEAFKSWLNHDAETAEQGKIQYMISTYSQLIELINANYVLSARPEND